MGRFVFRDSKGKLYTVEAKDAVEARSRLRRQQEIANGPVERTESPWVRRAREGNLPAKEYGR